MTISVWTTRLVAAAAIPAFVGVGVALGAPHVPGSVIEQVVEEAEVDTSYRPGEFGVDYTAVTGPQRDSRTTTPRR